MERLTSQLTKRERDILRCLLAGKRNREIGQELAIAEATVENHLHRLYQKLGVSSRLQAVTYALRCHKIEDSLQDNGAGEE